MVGFAIEALLSISTFPFLRYTIEPFSRSKERWLGADARIHGHIQGFRPLYMQFKRPSAYPDVSRSGIILDREELDLPVSPQTLFFSLRQKRKHHNDFQHNVLFRLHTRLSSRNLGNAAYVCPVFLDRSAYRFSMQVAGIANWVRWWDDDPWRLRDALINHRNGTVRFDRMPVLQEHATFPPHASVSEANHRYSFTENGTDLCFHSPTNLPDRMESLATLLKRTLNEFLSEGGQIKRENANEVLRSLVIGDATDEPVAPGKPDITSEDPIANWLSWGDFLKSEFDIEQYAFVQWDGE